MPVSKKKTSTEQKTLNIAKIGRSYNDIIDVYNQKILATLIEESERLRRGQVSNEDFKNHVTKKISSESEKFKSWGWDILLKNLIG